MAPKTAPKAKATGPKAAAAAPKECAPKSSAQPPPKAGNPPAKSGPQAAGKAGAKAAPEPKAGVNPQSPAGSGSAAAKALKAEQQEEEVQQQEQKVEEGNPTKEAEAEGGDKEEKNDGKEEEKDKKTDEEENAEAALQKAEEEKKKEEEKKREEEERKKAEEEARAAAEEAERRKKERANGDVVLSYNMYHEKFPIKDGKIKAAEIDDVYCLSDVMPGCKIHLSTKSSEEKYKIISEGEIFPYIYEDPIGTFHDLEAGEEYFVFVEEDEAEFMKSLAKAQENFRGVKAEASRGEGCSCIEGNPCTSECDAQGNTICKDWENRFAVAKAHGWRG